MSWEYNRLIWSWVSLAMSSLCYVLIMRHDLYTLDVHYCFCLVAKQPFECSITIINGRLSRLGFEDLYTNTVCFTSSRPWSSEERLPSSCPGQGIDWDLLVCCFIYLFVYSALELWDSPLCICQGHFSHPWPRWPAKTSICFAMQACSTD